MLAVASQDIVQAKASLIERQVQKLQAERDARLEYDEDHKKDLSECKSAERG